MNRVQNFVSIFLIGALSFLISLGASAAQTTGGVNWLDPLGYQKPAFYPITVPDEATVANKYYIDQQSGSGSTCSQVSPCAWSGLSGKPGTTGGPAYVYVRGNARLNLTGTIYGSAGNEIVIKPWPGSASIVTFANDGSGQISGANTISGSGVHHIIIDGGSDLLFSFTGTGSSQNAYTLNISASNITVARTRIQGGSAQGPALGIATGATGIDNVWWINNEMYNTPNYYGVYTGGGASCSGGNTSHSNLHFVNSIFRQICGRGIQIEPRTSGTSTYIEGNAFHDGFDGLSCGVSISHAIEPATACGGNINGVYVRNNLAFELGGGFLQLDGSNIIADNNTVYRYGKTTPITLGSHAFSPAGTSNSGTLRNNIVLSPVQSGVNAFNRTGYTNTSSLCESGCSINSTPANTFTSTVQGSTYLQPKSGGSAVSAGANLTSAWSTLWNSAAFDYAGTARAGAGNWTIGAFEYGTSTPDTTPPTSPTNLSATAPSSSNISVSWTASTDNIGVTGYIVERCQGSGCSNFAQVGTPTASPFVDSGLTPNTFYNYHVRARDAANNLSGWSNVVGATTQGEDAVQTTGGVNWLDPLGYQKPAFYPITIPNEATVANKYWVTLNGGSGSACSQASPCALSSVVGKSGTHGDGGGAYIYLKGSGQIGAPVLYGTAGNEIVIKPWDDNTTATITGRNNWSQQIEYVVFDGGPNAQIRFVNSGSGQFDPTIYFASDTKYNQDHLKFVRTRWQVTNAGEWIASWGSFQDVSWINSEFYATGATVTDAQHHVYLSGGAGVAAHTMDGVYLLNNIFRDTPGEAIELRMAQSGNILTNLVINGNAFHNVGKGTCSNSWGCRGAVTFSNEGGGTLTLPMRVSNNIMWNLGQNCMRTWDNPTGTQIYGNTCYNWGMGSPATGAYGSVAFTNYSFNDASGAFVNNVLYAAGSDANGNDKQPFPGSAPSSNKSYNACEMGEACGTNMQSNLNTSSFVSLDENDSGFLKTATGASPLDHGTSISGACVSPDYWGTSRPQGTSCDIGAFEYNNSTSDTTPPTSPINLTATSPSQSSITVTWNPATDNIGVTGYIVERCQGSGCSNFTQVGTPTASPFVDSGLTSNTFYNYHVRARDAANNLSGWSNVVGATTQGEDAVQTTGGVNWLDPLGYQKPAFYPITIPNEATVANKYWVNMSGGSGSTCSMTSPCVSIDNVIGKPGTTGGPAYIYIKGSGNWSGYNDILYGSVGNEIVIKPWPAGSTGCASECSATFTANSNANSSSIHHIIFDGGPSQNLSFTSSGGDQYNFHVIADNITFYRIRAYATAGGSMLFAVGDNRVVNAVKFINSEFYSCDQTAGYQCSAVYWGPGSGGGFTNTEFRNNIVRNMGGEGIEINPRATSSGLIVSGNAFHNVGKKTCSGAWGCRPAITFGNQGPGSGTTGAIFSNNLLWDTGSGCLWDRGGQPGLIANNTCYDYAKIGTDPWPNGIAGYSDSGPSTVRNNIIYSPNGTNPFDGTYAGSNNLCASGKSCGSSNQVWNASTLLSTDENTVNFLQVGMGSNAKDTGVTVAGVTDDYTGTIRSQGASFDIGAFEYDNSISDTTPPTSPTNLVAASLSQSSISVSWNPATDNVAVTGYVVDRCQGTGCTNFTQVGTPTASPFVDSGLTSNTFYNYHVRATDAAGNFSGWSNVVGATTQSTVQAPCNTVTTSNFSEAAYNSYGAPFDAFQTSTNLMNTTCTSADTHTINLTTGVTGDTTRIVYTKGYWYDAVTTAWRQYTGTCTGALNGEWCQGSVSAAITDANVSTASAAAPTYLVGMTCSVQGGSWKCGCRDTSCTNFSWQIQGAGQ